MDSVKDRIPTKREITLLLLVIVFPIHIWAIIMYLYEVPAYINRMPLWDVFGIFAYTQVVALIESVLVLAFLIFVCIALPRRLFKDKFVSQGTLLFMATFIFMIPVHYQMRLLEGLNWDMGPYQALVAIWVIVYLVTLFGASILIRRSQKFETILLSFVEKATLLSMLYLVVDVLSLGIVIFRNLI